MKYEVTFNIQIAEAKALIEQANFTMNQIVKLGVTYKDITQLPTYVGMRQVLTPNEFKL